jgi:hypothetical protein
MTNFIVNPYYCLMMSNFRVYGQVMSYDYVICCLIGREPSYRSASEHADNETTFQRILENFKCSNLKLEYLSRPIYARQTFLFFVFAASLVRFLFMLLQILLPDGLFFLNYLVIIPSICYYSLFTILSCYFNQLYNLYYVSSSAGPGNGARQSSYPNRIAMISAYFQYTLLFFIPVLYLLCIAVYSTKPITTERIDNGSNSSITTTTTTSDNEMNIFQWVYLLFRFILLFSLIYAGTLIYSKIYVNANSSVTLSTSTGGISQNNPRIAESQVIITRLLIVLGASAFGITASIIYGIMNIYGR